MNAQAVEPAVVAFAEVGALGASRPARCAVPAVEVAQAELFVLARHAAQMIREVRRGAVDVQVVAGALVVGLLRFRWHAAALRLAEEPAR